jgi:hypothetical protein
MQQEFYQYKVTQISNVEAIREDIDPDSPNFGDTVSLREPYWEITVGAFATESHYGDTRTEAVESYLASVGATDYTVTGTGSGIEVLDGAAQPVTLTMNWMNKDTMMRVGLYFSRRLVHGLHRVFLDDQDRKVVFAGKQKRTETQVQAVWDVIEAKGTTPFPGRANINRSNHRDRQFPVWMKKKFLLLTVDGLSDQALGELTVPLMDDADPENPVEVKRRKHHIDFENIPELSATQVRQLKNPNAVVDLRAATRVNMGLRKKIKTLP